MRDTLKTLKARSRGRAATHTERTQAGHTQRGGRQDTLGTQKSTRT